MHTVTPLLALCLAATNLVDPLSDTEREQAKEWIEAMKVDKRGPYKGVLWYCKDGTVLAPKKYACEPHGGGDQYGVPKDETVAMGKMGLYVGTILNALPAAALSPDNYYRARALVIECYLERALDGWALQTAKTYRGFRQVEDEVEAARWQLIDLAGRSDVLAKHRLMLIRLMRALPYGKNSSRADTVRAMAGVLGDEDPEGFGDVRFKIHAMPEPADIQQVEAYAAKVTGDRAKKAQELIEEMRGYYDPAQRLERLVQVKQWIWDTKTKEMIDTFAQVDPKDSLAVVDVGRQLIATAEAALGPARLTREGERNLLLVHVMELVEELWISVTADLTRRPLTRRQGLDLLEDLLQSSVSLGWLSPREQREALDVLAQMGNARPDPQLVASLASLGSPWSRWWAQDPPAVQAVSQTVQGMWSDPQAYAAGLARLSRVLEWARARLLADLYVSLERYQTVEPRAAGVIDDQLRSSEILPLAAVLDRFSTDVEQLRGGGHRLLGLSGVGTASLRGENPGLATGPLRVLPANHDPKALRRDEIALLFGLPPELPPVAGLVTVGAAGSLSHVSLLARNLGIPHATVGGEVATALEKLAGKEVLLGVSAGGRVAVGDPSSLRRRERRSLLRKRKSTQPVLKIDERALNLTDHRVRQLSEISDRDSGVRVGPKAGELGRLKRLFPNHVSDAVVIPFGAFVRHVDRPDAAGGTSPLGMLRAAYGQTRKLRPAEAEQRMLGELEKFRQAIATRPFADGFENEIAEALAQLGAPDTFGVFVRSDTNVEDLKEFTGAGLNLTVPHRVGIAHILAAIRRVWASPFSERSYRWRQRLLSNPEHVYPSVILHRTVPSEISGVMVTTDLATGDPNALTVSASEGVAAVVDGGAPETVVISPGGELRLIASSRTATRKIIPPPPEQGVVRVEAVGLDPLLGPKQIAALSELAREVKQKIQSKDGLPWDIEFGFVGEQVFLMQIRPLRISRSAALHPFLKALDDKARLPEEMLGLGEALPTAG